MIRIYTASKLSEASFWRHMHDEWPEVYCHARWLKHSQIGTPDSPELARRFWVEDEEDVRHADAVVVYGRDDQHLRGALVEAGIAIALRKPVFVVGTHADYGTWQYHPGVTRVASFKALRAELQKLEAMLG